MNLFGETNITRGSVPSYLGGHVPMLFRKGIGQTAEPVVRYTGFGYHNGFADKDGNQVTTLYLEVPEGASNLPIGRDSNEYASRNLTKHPDRASIGVVMGQEERRALIRHLTETCDEYDRAFPVKVRRRSAPRMRSRS